VPHGYGRQLRQLGDVGGDAPGLVAGEQLGRCASSKNKTSASGRSQQISVGSCLRWLCSPHEKDVVLDKFADLEARHLPRRDCPGGKGPLGPGPISEHSYTILTA
jgi:hypothetical protein